MWGAALRSGLLLVIVVASAGQAVAQGVEQPLRKPGASAGSTTPAEDCDRLAAAPGDPGKASKGVAFDALEADDAIGACRAALATDPASARFAFQLGRALHKSKAHEEALGHYRRAADKGSTAAMLGLGTLYKGGLGVPRDHGQAAAWYRKAAEKGHAGAMLELALAYLNGRGVSRDSGQAMNWLHQAAEKGNGRAMSILGVTYNWGLGVPQDHGKAAELMFGALSRGDPSARREMTRNAASWGEPFRTVLQLMLAMADVYAGTIDGSFGRDTHRAIRALAKK